MIRILHVFNMMGNGGIEHYVMDLYRNIDREKVQFDFLLSVDEDGYFADEIKALGGKIHHAYPLKSNPIKNYKDITRIVRENKYNIVHRHTGSAFGYFDLKAAKKGGAQFCILHSHNPEVGKPIIHYMSKLLFKTECIKFACSQKSGEFLFGKNTKFSLVKNAIDTEKYKYSLEKRKEIRQKYGIGDDVFVVGHVGGFTEQKNHQKLLDIFNSILKLNQNSCLICIGGGRLMHQYETYAKELGIYDRIIFAGTINNVHDFLNAFDVFVFPSLFEGFPITLLEAQVNGLKCVTTLNKVPEEINVTGNVLFLPLSESSDYWAKEILNINLSRDKEAIFRMVELGYDIHDETTRMKKLERKADL